jgi:hypothetical protein
MLSPVAIGDKTRHGPKFENSQPALTETNSGMPHHHSRHATVTTRHIMVVFKPRKKSQQQKPSFSVGENAEKVTKAAQATKPTKARIPVSATDQATKTLAKYKRKWKTNGYSKNPYIFVCGHAGCGVTTGVNRRQLPREHDMQGHERHMNAIVWCIDIATFIAGATRPCPHAFQHSIC